MVSKLYHLLPWSDYRIKQEGNNLENILHLTPCSGNVFGHYPSCSNIQYMIHRKFRLYLASARRNPPSNEVTCEMAQKAKPSKPKNSPLKKIARLLSLKI